MKVETPQLRWHQIVNPQTKQDAGANGPILSCSLLTINDNVGVLATAGNTEVNLWRVGFTPNEARVSAVTSSKSNSNSNNDTATKNHILVQPQTATSSSTTTSGNKNNSNNITEHTQIEHIATLSRGTNERSINAVKFSPSGHHLLAAGDAGTIVVWTVPTTSVGTYWSTAVQSETDLPMKIIFNQTEDVMDVSWSADSKRFTVCSLDHTVTVWENVDNNNNTNNNNGNGIGNGGSSSSTVVSSEWKNVHRSSKDHTHYVQGVAYDPKGVYLASMGSDRMVKIYSRKNTVKDGVVKGELAKYTTTTTTTATTAEGEDASEEGGEGEGEQERKKAILQTKVLPELLTNSNFVLQNKIKTMKFLNAANKSGGDNKASSNNESNNSKNSTTMEDTAAANNNNAAPNAKRHHMFADELTLGSFFRRLSFTTDGAFLVVPAALWHGRNNGNNCDAGTKAPGSPTSISAVDGKLAESSFATYLFARHHFDQPYKVLTGLEKPSVVVRPNPVLFQLPSNATPSSSCLPYRSVFAVLTLDTVLIYDTHHNNPIAMARGLHYAGLTDAAWSSDGKTLFVTSSDGYVSILSFGNGELGAVYDAPELKIVKKAVVVEESTTAGEIKDVGVKQQQTVESNGLVVNTLVAKKKPRAAAPVADDSSGASASEGKRVTFSPVNEIKQIEPRPQPEPVVINTLTVRKKKKKIAPTLVAASAEPKGENAPSDAESGTMEKKRAAEEVSEPPSAEGPTVNILLPKKKKKVAGSSVATS